VEWGRDFGRPGREKEELGGLAVRGLSEKKREKKRMKGEFRTRENDHNFGRAEKGGQRQNLSGIEREMSIHLSQQKGVDYQSNGASLPKDSLRP